MQQTHYDTLKVSRDAPVEVIRAAYRVLSQKYHPDRHPADSAAADTMGLLNKAYEVLSDPERRLAHDAWIRQIEAESPQVRKSKATTSRPAGSDLDRGIGNDAAPSDWFALHLRQFGILYGIGLVVVVGLSLVVLLAVAHEPQLAGWVAATPAAEDREAYIRQVARELMLRRRHDTQGSAAITTAPDAAASPSDTLPASATEPEPPVKRPEVSFDGDAPPNDTTRPAMHLGEEAPSPPELPSAPQPHEEAADGATTPPNHIKPAAMPSAEQSNP